MSLVDLYLHLFLRQVKLQTNIIFSFIIKKIFHNIPFFQSYAYKPPTHY